MSASKEEVAQGIKVAQQEMEYKVDLYNRRAFAGALQADHKLFCLFVLTRFAVQDGCGLLREVHGQEVAPGSLLPGLGLLPYGLSTVNLI